MADSGVDYAYEGLSREERGRFGSGELLDGGVVALQIGSKLDSHCCEA